MAVQELIRQGVKLFENKEAIDSLWQEIAYNFYPERANFTDKRHEGEEYSDHLFSSYPVLARRELGNMFSASLRPQNNPWLKLQVDNETLNSGREERAFLEFLSDIQRRAMYDRKAQFIKATRAADHDYAAFGNTVIHIGTNSDRDALLYRTYHLRDCAWTENAEGVVDNLHRRWHPTARQLAKLFPGKLHQEVEKMASKEPEKEVKCHHAFVPSRIYPYKNRAGKDFPFVSVYIDVDNEHIMEEVGFNSFRYAVPRWQPLTGSAYGRSMATAVALPDGRTMQVVSRTMREAGEKYVDPPMIAVVDALRGDMATYAGGVTIADMEYDERLGEVLRPITQDRSGYPIGEQIAEALKADIASAFFLDKLSLPESRVEMTAFEVRRRLEEQIRSSSPIFEPIENEYSQPLAEITFDVLLENGAFPMEHMPDSLAGRDIEFKFKSPLSDMADQVEAAVFQEGINSVLGPALQVDPTILAQVDLHGAARDALMATGFKAKWLKDEETAAKEIAAAKQQQAQQAAMMQAEQAAAVVEQGGNAAQAIEEAS